MLEERGSESLWFPEHTHIPASRETPYPAGGELPPEYSRTLDPFVALTAAAAATTTLRIGTGICLVVERDPIVTAKEVASLDHLSQGRLLFGVGAGWNREEMANHGTDPRTRMALMAERVEAMKALWTEEEATYRGDHVAFERVWSWPKPLQRPHPPVYVGGNGPTVLDRVLRFGDGWMPNVVDDDTLLGQIAELRSRAGRDVPVTLNAAPRRPERLARYVEAGVERAIFYLRQGDRAALEERLDKDAALLEGLS
jgi:probable F420-dependent oxidoreductase